VKRDDMVPRSRQALRLTTVLAILVLLSSCGVPNPFERKSAMTRWTEATSRGEYGAAQQLLLEEDAPAWRAEAERLATQHGRVRAIQSDDIVPSQGRPIRSVRVTWADGYERCLRVGLPVGERIDVLDSGWQDCAAVSFNPTPGP